MSTIRAALSNATLRLGSVSQSPRLDAELLMAHAIGVDRNSLLLGDLDALPSPDFDTFLARRLAHEPLAYITGTRDFWTISLRVTPGVLIPRADSETLIEAAITHFARKAPTRILDLGTGSGALLLAALDQWPQATGLGIDASAAALAVAQDNASQLGLAARCTFEMRNWADGLEQSYDLILCNPPYVEASASLDPQVFDYEPHSALFAGVDGLDDYVRIAPQLPPLLAAGGVAVIEIGYRQAESVGAIFAAQGFLVAVAQDLGKRDRCLILTR
ncbi:MAG: hypothetical protein RIS52_1020 [Pseudomonadota bacterium]